MAEVGAPTHDFLMASWQAGGFIPGVTNVINAGANYRPTNQATISSPQGPAGRISESRTILDSPSGPTSMMPGASGVSGTTKVPIAPSGPNQTGVNTPEENTLGRIFGGLGRMARKQEKGLAGNASGGRGRSGGPANNTDNVYSAGRDNIVGSTYAAGVSGHAAVNQGTNYGVMGGQDNRVNQMFFSTGNNSPMAVGAQPTATAGPAGRAGSVPKRRTGGSQSTTPKATPKATPPTTKTPTATPTAPPTTAPPTAQTPTAPPTAQTPTAQTPSAPPTVPPWLVNTQTPTAQTPAAPTTGSNTPPTATTSNTPSVISFPLTPIGGTPTVQQGSSPSQNKPPTAATPPVANNPDNEIFIVPQTPPTSTINTIKELANGTGQRNVPTTQIPVTSNTQSTTGSLNETGQMLASHGWYVPSGGGNGPFTDQLRRTPLNTSGPTRGPGIRERFAAIMGSRRKAPNMGDIAPPEGIPRPTVPYPGATLGGGPGERPDGTYSTGDPLMDTAHVRDFDGPPTDTFKKIEAMTPRTQRRIGV